MPDTRREQALVAVERARRHVGTAPADPLRITISAGICDTESAGDASELLRLADSALYWSKAHGRDQAWIYDSVVISELSQRQRAEGMQRAQSLLGLRALVRAQEEREPRWRAHSERVSELAARLATAAGWPRERGMLLAQAALMHDVGAIAGEPLPAAWPMGAAEIEARRSGAALSARLVDGLLGAEQVGWIAAQYRPPVAVAPGSLLSGGSLMALADTWDTLTAVAPGMPGDALSECERLSGVCFDGGAVGVLGHLYRAGELSGGPAGSSVGSPV
jgi:hypothetical protein